nr:hypothetical protein [Mucilaginibacter sp. X5P1]
MIGPQHIQMYFKKLMEFNAPFVLDKNESEADN